MQADPRRIHELEYELGFRDDPPPPVFTDEPGQVIYYRGTPPTVVDMAAVLKSAWTSDRTA